MKTKAVAVLAVSGVLCAALIWAYASSLKRVASVGQATLVNSPTAQRPPQTAIKRLEESPRSQQELDAIAASHIKTIKERADANTSAAMAAAEADPETSASQIANEETAALEKSLHDSISSLTQQLIAEPGLTTNAISLLQMEENPETMMMIARALGEAAAALGDKFPYDLLLKMAENDPSLSRRQAAIMALAYMSKIPPDLEQRIAELSRNAALLNSA